ncbi:hypothetical protein PR048_007875 [Dryococelus australis]|uniref:Uncharacterized protein n=1 Tax=Dryococelus australis TaxID=614101 RepID=A0ABQ9HWE3_9NEOP|nr:hypothetical protein PR048_007875 [Dryococelus australis]
MLCDWDGSWNQRSGAIRFFFFFTSLCRGPATNREVVPCVNVFWKLRHDRYPGLVAGASETDGPGNARRVGTTPKHVSDTPPNRIRLERASRKQSTDTHKTPHDRVKRCWESFRARAELAEPMQVDDVIASASTPEIIDIHCVRSPIMKTHWAAASALFATTFVNNPFGHKCNSSRRVAVVACAQGNEPLLKRQPQASQEEQQQEVTISRPRPDADWQTAFQHVAGTATPFCWHVRLEITVYAVVSLLHSYLLCYQGAELANTQIRVAGRRRQVLLLRSGARNSSSSPPPPPNQTPWSYWCSRNEEGKAFTGGQNRFACPPHRLAPPLPPIWTPDAIARPPGLPGRTLITTRPGVIPSPPPPPEIPDRSAPSPYGITSDKSSVFRMLQLGTQVDLGHGASDSAMTSEGYVYQSAHPCPETRLNHLNVISIRARFSTAPSEQYATQNATHSCRNHIAPTKTARHDQKRNHDTFQCDYLNLQHDRHHALGIQPNYLEGADRLRFSHVSIDSQWRVLKCCKVSWCLLSAVRTLQEPVTRVTPGETECISTTHERAARPIRRFLLQAKCGQFADADNNIEPDRTNGAAASKPDYAMEKRKYGAWNEPDMEMALAAYRSGDNECCRQYGIPKATLKRHMDGLLSCHLK